MFSQVGYKLLQLCALVGCLQVEKTDFRADGHSACWSRYATDQGGMYCQCCYPSISHNWRIKRAIPWGHNLAILTKCKQHD